MRFAVAIIASSFVAAGAAPALASDVGASDTVSLAACDRLGDQPSRAEIRVCVEAAARFVEAHCAMIEQAARDLHANEAALQDAAAELSANEGALRDAERELGANMDALRDAARQIRESAEALRDVQGHAPSAEPTAPDQSGRAN